MAVLLLQTLISSGSYVPSGASGEGQNFAKIVADNYNQCARALEFTVVYTCPATAARYHNHPDPAVVLAADGVTAEAGQSQPYPTHYLPRRATRHCQPRTSDSLPAPHRKTQCEGLSLPALHRTLFDCPEYPPTTTHTGVRLLVFIAYTIHRTNLHHCYQTCPVTARPRGDSYLLNQRLEFCCRGSGSARAY